MLTIYFPFANDGTSLNSITDLYESSAWLNFFGSNVSIPITINYSSNILDNE